MIAQYNTGAAYWRNVFSTPRLYTHPLPKQNEKLALSDLFTTGGEWTLAAAEPVAIKAKQNNFFDVISALKPICSSDKFRPSMNGIFLDSANGGNVVATDGFVLVKIPATECRFKIERSAIIHPKTGNVIEETYPNWSSVVPRIENFDAPIARATIADLLNRLAPGLRATKFVTALGADYTARLANGETTTWIDPHNVERVLRALAVTGTTEVDIWNSTPLRPVLFTDTNNPEKIGLTMPIRPNNSSPVAVWNTLATKSIETVATETVN